MNKRFLAMSLAGAMTVGLLAGCGSGSTESAGSGNAAASGGTYTVAWCNNSSADDFQVALTENLEKYAADYNIELTVYDAQGDTQTQADQVSQAVAQGVDAILITPNDGTGIGPALKEAHDAGVTVITTASDIDESYADSRDCYVGTDDNMAGELAGQAMAEAFPDGGKIVEIEGQAGYDAQIKRTDGFAAAIEGTNLELLDKQACSQWDASEAMDIMEDYITKYGDEIDGIFVHWDVGAAGAIEALKASNLNLEDLYIVSIDGCSVGVNLVKDGETDICIMQDMEAIGKGTLEQAQKALDGEDIESVVNPDLVVVTSDNADDYSPIW